MEILGLIDTLESMILDGFKVPLTKKTMIDEEKVLSVIDKIRLVVQGGGDFVKKVIDKRSTTTAAAPTPLTHKQASIDYAEARKEVEKVKETMPATSNSEEKAVEIIENAYKIAKEVRMGADKYADEVLANLELTSGRVLRAVKAGRQRLNKYTGSSSLMEDE
ncbi:hypothetical protein ACFLZ2_02720 [Candidatus Margulisiibacteriota bacterium]